MVDSRSPNTLGLWSHHRLPWSVYYLDDSASACPCRTGLCCIASRGGGGDDYFRSTLWRSDAIHPGYGFLSENAHFAEVCESIGVKFIGPTSEHIALLGDKAKAREIVARRGLPVTPGSPGELKSEQEALDAAGKIGYPVIIKASAGGGGRGMRVVNKAEDLERAFQAAQAEAKTTFGNDAVYLERYFLEPRHIEVQIAADHRGHVVHLGERDCSVQRRHQKLVEETPSPAVDEKLRREICRVAVEAVKAVHYRNVGTVEFLLDKDHNFFFMEVNTRIQEIGRAHV